jgi:hypothetical protein
MNTREEPYLYIFGTKIQEEGGLSGNKVALTNNKGR